MSREQNICNIENFCLSYPTPQTLNFPLLIEHNQILFTVPKRHDERIFALVYSALQKSTPHFHQSEHRYTIKFVNNKANIKLNKLLFAELIAFAPKLKLP